MRYKRKRHTYKSQQGGGLGAAARQVAKVSSMVMARILRLVSKVAKPTIQFAKPIAAISRVAKPVGHALNRGVVRPIAHAGKAIWNIQIPGYRGYQGASQGIMKLNRLDLYPKYKKFAAPVEVGMEGYEFANKLNAAAKLAQSKKPINL